MAINPVPAGVYRADGNGLVRVQKYVDADAFSMNGATVAAHSPQLAGLYSDTFFRDPSLYGNLGMSAYAAELSIGNALSSGYMDNSGYNIDRTYPIVINSQPASASPASTPSSGNSTSSASNGTSSTSGASGASSTSGGYTTSSAQPSGSNTGYGGITLPTAPNSVYEPASVGSMGFNSANGSTSTTNPFAISLGQPSYGYSGAPSGDLNAPKDDDTSGKINSRIALIEKYCDKYGKTVDIAKLIEECSKDPEEGLKKCDEILNDEFDQAKLEKLVKKEYEEYNKARLEAGKQVSETWVDEISRSGLDRANLSAAGVTKDNVLDVIGTFMTNDKVKSGRVSMDEVFEKPEITAQLIDTIKARADEFLVNEDVDEDTKNNITVLIGSLRDNYDKYQESIEDDNKHNDIGFNEVRFKLVHSFMELNKNLRGTEARLNDKIAAKYYGLPDDSSIKFNEQTKRFNEEQKAYNERRRLSTSI